MAAVDALAEADALIAKGVCPVKASYIRPFREKQAEPAVVSADADRQAPNEQVSAQKKSRKRDRKDRAQADQTQLCFHFLRGACRMGDKCKFTHSVDAYLASRPPDLPGECPFKSLPQCPYGIRCRWASKHEHPDELTRQHIIEPAALARRTCDAEDHSAAAGHGTSGATALELPVSATLEPAVNELSVASRTELRKKTYDFSRADACLRSLGVSINQPMRYRAKQPPQAAAAPGAARAQSGAGGAAAAQRAQGEAVQISAPATAAANPPQGGAATAADAVARADVAAMAVRIATDDDDTKEALGLAGRRTQDAASGAVPVYDGTSSQKDSAAVRRDVDRKRFDFRDKLYCAPLTTNGNLPFRRIVKGFGCDVTCGEMALCTNLLQGQASEWALLKRHPSEDCFGVQICGSHPDSVARCVQLIDDTIDVDFIDINMGCPIDLICEKGAGSALLQRPKRIESIVRAAAAVAARCGVTFKTRTAFHKKQMAHTFLPQAGAWGARAVTLHGRTREQRYQHSADWEYISQVAADMPDSVQLIGNGDVFSYEDYEAHMADGKLATCMIARGALIKPWLFQEIKERRHWDISAGERLDVLKDFARFGLEHWGSDEKGVEATRRFLLEWLSFMHRYVPVGLLERVPQQMTWRPPDFVGRSDLETLLASSAASDWVRISEMLLGPTPAGFVFTPKHKSNAYAASEADMARVMSELRNDGSVVAAI